MAALGLAALAAWGTHYLVTALAFGWTGLRAGPAGERRARPGLRPRVERWLRQAGACDLTPERFVAATVLVAIAGGVAGAALFGSPLPALAVAAFAATSPVATYRSRRARRLAAAHDAWPRMIEEIRVLVGAAGRSIPQALLEVGRRGPDELRDAFAAAHREWLLTTDFDRTIALLEERLADPTADAACETLLVAHEIGGADLDHRLAELAEDRRIDQLARKDARAEQAGVRFARRFVIGVPVGMAVAGMSLGNGRAAYGTPGGQLLVLIGLGLVAVCWVWSGSMLRLPEQDRVFG